MKHLTFVLFALMTLQSQSATTVSIIGASPGLAVPDNSAIGLAINFSVSSPIISITELTVSLNLSGGWAGDLFCYISHESGISILLNRPGRSASSLDGSAANSLSLTLADNGLSDIHTDIPDASDVTGFFQPDARLIDPDFSLDSSPRTAFLSSFDGLDPNGEWTLFIADLAPGETMILNSYALNMVGEVIPEPSISLLVVAGIGLSLRRRRGNA